MRVHLLADDGDDLVEGALAEEEVAVDAGAELADVAGAEQEACGWRLRHRRGFAERGNEELGPTVHWQKKRFPAHRSWLREHFRMSHHSKPGNGDLFADEVCLS